MVNVQNMGHATLLLVCLQFVFYVSLFLEGSEGRGTLVFTIVFAVGCMLAPFLIFYSFIYSYRQSFTRREDLAVYVPITTLLATSWIFTIGVLKLFLDHLGKDVLVHVIPAFNTKDHILAWTLLVTYLLTAGQALRMFRRQVRLMGPQMRRDLIRDPPGRGTRTLFVFQFALAVVFFIVGVLVLGSEDPCAVCEGCVRVVGHEAECALYRTTETSCREDGLEWCEEQWEPSFDPGYIASLVLVFATLGVVFFIMVMFRFGDASSVMAIRDQHKWTLSTVAVLIANSLVCGSGLFRVFMRVLQVHAFADLFPVFSTTRRVLFFVICMVYLAHLPVCFFLMHGHLFTHERLLRKGKGLGKEVPRKSRLTR